jgi:FdhE protein
MPSGRRIVADMTNIGEQAKPPFAVLPEPSELFLARAERLAALAPEHKLGPYLDFLAKLAAAQHAILSDLPPTTLPAANRIAQSLTHGMPPLSRATMEADAAMLACVEQLAARLGSASLSPETMAVVNKLREALPSQGLQLISSALKEDDPAENVAERVLVLAGLQVHFARLAALLDDKELKPIANAACPSCGSAPMVSSIVGWPRAYNTRYCNCGLCGTMWNVIRAMCVLCGTTDGVSFRNIDGHADKVKAETCDKCRGYVKVVYQVQDTALEPLSDDVASVGLDMMLVEEGWKRGGNNPFLLGY